MDIKKEIHIEVTLKTLFISLGFLAGVFLLWQIRDVLVLLFIALIISLALEPAVEFFERKRLPRIVSVAFVFFGLLLFILGVLTYGLSPMVEQTTKLISRLPDLLAPLIERISRYPEVEDQIRLNLSGWVAGLTENVVGIALGIFSNLFSLVSMLFFTFYFLADWENIKKRILSLVNRGAKGRAENLLANIERGLGGWLRGVAILGAVVGLLTFVGLWALGMEYALPLAVIAGLFEMVPIIGPIISAVPAVIVGFGTSLELGVFVIILYAVVQQLENNLIVPSVMGKASGFTPLVTLILVLIGAKLLGVVGLLLAIPSAIFFSLLAKDFLNWKP